MSDTGSHGFDERHLDVHAFDLNALVERFVRAFLSQVSLDPDIAVEVFVLEPGDAEQAPEGIA